MCLIFLFLKLIFCFHISICEMGIFVLQLVNEGYERDQAEEESSGLEHTRVRKFKKVCGLKR